MIDWKADLPRIAEVLGADTVLRNGKIITVDDADCIAESVAVKYGRVARVGSDEEVEGLIHEGTEVIDLEGRAVTPGLISTHDHFLRYGLNARFGIDLWYPKVRSIADIVEAVERKVAETPKGEWVFGYGWDENLLEERRPPNRWDLDPVSQENPVYLGRVYQMVSANSLALKEAGVTRETPDPEYGRIYRDGNGEPTGVFLTILPSANPFRDVMPAFTTRQKEEAIVKACRDYNAEGMTMVVDPGVGKDEPDDIVAYENVWMRGELTMRVYALYGFIRTVGEALDAARRVTTYGDDMFRLGGVKLSLDGGAVPKTALFYEPYAGEPENRGRTKWRREELAEAVQILHDAGLQCCIHAIGDEAIDWSIDAIEAAMERNPRPDPRHQIIHIYYPTPEAVDRVERLGIMANVQSTFIHFEGDTYVENLGEGRGECVKPLRTLVGKGIAVGNSQDYPSGPMPARLGLWAAVARETMGGRVICPDERLTVQEALRTYTIWAARHVFMEDRIGSIEVGKYADLVVWSEDPYTVPTERLKDLRAELT
ncbi:MAG: amidohydrolase, partial [Candidatus Bathyarchaeia archaeon]